MTEFLRPGVNREDQNPITEVQDAQWSDRINQVEELFDSDGHLNYSAFAEHIFPGRNQGFRFGSLWEIAKEYATRALDAHPHAYPDGLQSLWTALEDDADDRYGGFNYSDFRLTGSGVILLIEAWNTHAIVQPATFTMNEYKDLSYWRYYAPDLVRIVFPVVSLPPHLRSGTANPQLQQRLSNMHMQEAVQQHAAATATAGPSYNRPRYAAKFSRIQAYGLEQITSLRGDKPRTQAFFLPASQILSHMQKYFRSSTAFEGQKWSNAEAYRQHVQFTNIMLLNVCSEVSRQIITMFRLQEAYDPEALLLPLDQLLDEEILSSEFPTITERILGHSEPLEWLPPIGINLQRFLGSSSAVAAAARHKTATVLLESNAQMTDVNHAPVHAAGEKRRGRPPKARPVELITAQPSIPAEVTFVRAAAAATDQSYPNSDLEPAATARVRKIARIGPLTTFVAAAKPTASTPAVPSVEVATSSSSGLQLQLQNSAWGPAVAELHALLTPAHGHAMITALSAKIHQLQQPASPADLHAALTYVLQELRAKPSLVRDIQAGLLSVTSYLSDGHQAALAQTAAHSQATPAPYPTAPVVRPSP